MPGCCAQSVCRFCSVVITLCLPALLRADVVPGEILVGLADGHTALRSAPLQHAIDAVGVVAASQPQIGALRLKLRPGMNMAEAIRRLRGRPDVRYAEPNNVQRALATPNDTYYADYQYAPQLTKTNLAWDIWTPSAQVVIAIVDTGIDNSHPDLTNKIFRDASGIVGFSAFTGARDNARDGNGHGTHCAGIAAAEINNGTGIAGIAGWNPSVPNANSYIKLMPVKVLDADGSGSDSTVAAGVVWAADHGAKVISMSLGSAGPSTTLSDAVQYAWSKGCLLAAAAGNESTSSLSYPAAYTNVISVAATDDTDTLTSFSNYGSWVDVAAPGSQILSTTPTYTTPENLNLSYDILSGTSMATPHVAGEAALILAQAPSLTNSQAAAIIVGNVDPYTPYGVRTLASGAGRINVYKALQAIPVPQKIVGLSFSPNPTFGGLTVTGTVVLSGSAPAGGTTVSLSSSNTAVAQVPATVTVSPGANSATFAITTSGVSAITPVVVRATLNGTTWAITLRLYPATIAALGFLPNPIFGGLSATGTLALRGLAPTGGLVATLSSDTPAVAQVPASVTIPAGASAVTFPITTSGVASLTRAVIRATVNGVTWAVTLYLYPPYISALSFSPNPVTGGNTATGNLRVSGAAPAGGQLVTLSSANPAVAQVPASVTIPAGGSGVTFPITTTAVTTLTPVVISATVNGNTWRITLYVRP